ncbi:MAG TPA: arabinan endo-1,5-alpha-L-arabinosidase, partial [Firmicutes bacterium]|nr:arabinan endo-1,5-alpha-L-arabinosidase [Bacillota bacterium]
MIRSKSLIYAAVLFLLVGCGSTSIFSESSSTSGDVPITFNNPVWEPVLADPSIIRGDDGTFYAFGTQDNA